MTDKYTVVVTGANRGLGLEFVKQILAGSAQVPFVPADCIVVATSRNTTDCKDLIALQGQYEGRLHIMALDQADTASITHFGESIANANIKSIHMLICNSGIIESDPSTCTKDLDQAEALRIFQVNSIGPILVVNALMPYLNNAHIACGGTVNNVEIDKNGGSDGVSTVSTADGIKNHIKGMFKPKAVVLPTNVRVIFISSSMGSIGAICNSNVPTYRVSKAALNGYIRCLSFDHPHIAFMPLHPGWVQTDMGSRGDRSPPLTTKESIEGCLKQINEHCVVGQASKAMYSHDDTTWVW